jgi:periplasmic protein TonB
MRLSVQAKEIRSSADGTLPSLAPVSPGRPWTGAPGNFSAAWCRWALTGVFSTVVHGVALLLLWGMRTPVPGTHAPSHAAIYVTLASPRVAPSATSGNLPSAALPEEHRSAEEQPQRGDRSEERAKPQRKKTQHLRPTRNLAARPGHNARPASPALPSLASQTLPASGLGAGTGATTPAASEGGTTSENEVANRSSSRTDGHSAEGVVGGEDTAPLPLSEVARAPVLITQTVPHYPERARLLGVAGLVRLEAILSREGRIEQGIKVLESVPLLDEAASDALRQWRFKPARDDSGRPVRVILEVPFRFTLK